MLPGSITAAHHHPWRRLRELTGWRLEWRDDLGEGRRGLTLHEHRLILMRRGLSQAERRCTIEHERQHVLDPEATEVTVDRRTARILLPDIRAVGESLAWARDLDEAADDLWVDVDTLRKRLAALHPAERGYLRRRLELLEPVTPGSSTT